MLHGKFNAKTGKQWTLTDGRTEWLTESRKRARGFGWSCDGMAKGLGLEWGGGCLKTTGEWLAGGNRPALILLTILFSSPPFFACRAELFQFDASACGKLLLTAFAVEWHKLIRKSNEATTTMMVKVTRLRCTAPRPPFLDILSWEGVFSKIWQLLDYKNQQQKYFVIIVCFLIQLQ